MRMLAANCVQVAYCGSIDAQLRQTDAQLSGSQLRIITGSGASPAALDGGELEVRSSVLLPAAATPRSMLDVDQNIGN